MPAFDEILILEEQVQTLSMELNQQRDLVRAISKKDLDARNEIERLTKQVKSLEATYWHMKKEAPVVLLAEFEHVARLLEEHRDQLAAKRQEIGKWANKAKDAQANIKMLEARLRQATEKLSVYGKVVQFHR